MASPGRQRKGVTRRALVLGFALIPANIFFVTGQTWLLDDLTGWQSLFANTLSALLGLALLNCALERWRPAWRFGVGEMLTIYVLLGVSTGLVSVVWCLGGTLAGVISYPFWFASPSNEWESLLWPHLAPWLTVRDLEVLDGFYVGYSSAYRLLVLRAWAGPAFWWATFVGALMWVCLCLNSLVRRRWADEEKLPFPFVSVPVQLTEPRFGLLRNRLFWLGVALCLLLQIWNTLSSYLPSLPGVPLYFRFHQHVANRHPWDKIPFPVATLSPGLMGLIYLIPLEMTFSLFFFAVLWNVQYVGSAWLGWTTQRLGGFPYGQEQSVGGFLALVAAFLWMDRRYFARILRRALGLGPPLPGEGEEAFSYRGTVLGALAGLVYLWWFLSAAGMSAWVVPIFSLLYFAFALGISRLRAQVGPPNHSLAGMMPDRALIAAAGSRGLGAGTLGVFALLGPYLGQQANNPTPLQLEALQMAEQGRMERRRIAVAMALAAPLAVLCYFWVSIHYGYQLGMGTGNVNREVLTSARYIVMDLDQWVRYPVGPSGPRLTAMGVGFALVLALLHLKLRFFWWPLHPAAFPICLDWVTQESMIPLFVVWLVKLLLLSYGGLRAHRAALPFFLGLITGTALGTMWFGLLFRVAGVR